MSSSTRLLRCPICLGECRDPVVPPCGHPTCESCIFMYMASSLDPYTSTCPKCSASFSTALADWSDIPEKYHLFVSSPLRRVYLGDVGVDHTQAVIDDLELENAALRERIVQLNHENDCISGQWFETQKVADRLARGRRDAHSEANTLKAELEEAHLALDKAREDAVLTLEREAEYLESRTNERPVVRHPKLFLGEPYILVREYCSSSPSPTIASAA
ncbi:hypothetical protein BC827DRAFT_1373337 [Russula dissimulans]|nr:hypothetical protein BC827DRAFT_1373337 [Russula dissimulans]